MENILLKKNSIYYRIVSIALIAAIIVSAIMTVVFAWNDFIQHKTNMFEGTENNGAVLLMKYSKDIDGNILDSLGNIISEEDKDKNINRLPVQGAEFYLFKINKDGEEQIGGKFITSSSGLINVSVLEPGEYYFIEDRPGYGYTFDKDDNNDEIKKYYFTVNDEPTSSNIAVVTAYNRMIEADLVLSKIVNNIDGLPLTKEQTDMLFEFKVTFSDEGVYSYKIDNEDEKSVTSGDYIYLKSGQKAKFNLPIGVEYTIEETPVPDYVIISKNHQGTITGNGAFSEFINTYVPKNGTLSISKTVKNADGQILSTEQEAKKFSFTVVFGDGGTYKYKISNGIAAGAEQTLTSGGKIQLSDGETAIFTGLPAGLEYTVTEDDYSSEGYNVNINEYKGIIVRETDIPLMFINTYGVEQNKTGALYITKEVDGKAASKDDEFEFDVTFSIEQTSTITLPADPLQYTIYNSYADYVSNNGTQYNDFSNGSTIKLKHGQIAVFNDLPAGLMYNVKEKDYSGIGYIASNKEFSGAIVADDITRLKFINTKNPDTILTVKKVLQGVEIDPNAEFEFTLYINGVEKETFKLKNEESRVFTITYGDIYKVTENLTADYEFISITNGYGTANGADIEVIATNSSKAVVMTEIKGEKTWDMSADPTAKKPNSITVHLKKENIIVETVVVTPDKNGKWQYSFNAPKYDSKGNEIIYTVAEEPIDSYKDTVNGYNIKNTYIPPAKFETDIEVEIIIVNEVNKPNDKDVEHKFVISSPDGSPLPGNSPDSVQSVIMGEGTIDFGTIEFTQEGTYTYIITQLKGDEPNYVYDETAYTLTVIVKEINGELVIVSAGYTREGDDTVYDRAIFYNHYTDSPPPREDMIVINGKKKWMHGTNLNMPASITIFVKSGNYIVRQKVITENDNWKWSFELPKYDDNGHEINYTIDEADVNDYKKEIDGYDVTNIYKENRGNDDPTDPKTNDASNVWLWFIILVISILSLWIIMPYYRRLIKKK